jgi:hypothetical protein
MEIDKNFKGLERLENGDYFLKGEIITDHITLKLPSFESVSRCRRKILETRVDLQSDKTKLTREDEQKKYKEYSRV